MIPLIVLLLKLRYNVNSCLVQIEDTDDAADFGETMAAMSTMNMSSDEQSDVIQLVSGILHLGNVVFQEVGNDTAVVTDQRGFRNINGRHTTVCFNTHFAHCSFGLSVVSASS